MEIERVGVTTVSAPLDRVVSGSGYTKATRGTVVVEVETDSGVTGRIHSGDERDEQAELARYLVEDLAPAVVGEDPFSVERIWERLFEGATSAGDRALYMHALGALDTALWDTVGRALGTPLYRLWGGYRESLPMVAIGGYYEDDRGLDDLAAEAREYEEMDLAGMKLKVGGAPVETDLERLRAVEEATGGDFVVACDANRGWAVEEAVEFARAARGYDVEWFEEPVVWYDQYRGMRSVRERTGVPVSAGQSEIAPHGCRRLLDADAVDYLNFDASLGGGPTAWRKVAAAGELDGVSMGHHEEPQIAMHLLASVPNGTYAECFHPEVDPVWYRMVENTPTPREGRIELPDGPGIGLDLDEGFVEEHAVEVVEYP